MRVSRLIAGLLVMLGSCPIGYAKGDAGTVKKAVERSTLNQQGTKPFHLKAVLSPSRDSDRGSNRTGEVEIWWTSPTQFRQEVRSPEFHQIAIINGGHEWQKNEGDYYPEWLREMAVALITPVPSLDEVLKQVEEADVKKLAGTTHFSWTIISTDGNAKMEMGAGVAITDATGLLFYDGGFGWGGLYKDYENFHGRMVARTVSVGTPEVTAKVTTLEDLGEIPPGFFNSGATGSDASPVRTVVVDEISLRKNLQQVEPPVWPFLHDGPVQGAATTEIVVDRTGKIREIGTIVSNNQGVNEVFRNTVAAMEFKPYLENGMPVQVVSRITMPFKTVRPPGVEVFESAHDYFERGRRVGFPTAGKGSPYGLHAVFQAKVSSGPVEDGQYEDTWQSDSEWRREAWIGKSRYIRARDGEKRYQWAEGPDVGLLRLVFKVMEPIPAIDTFAESDWRMKRDAVDGGNTIRVFAGYEGPDDAMDPEHSIGYWFDETGKLVKTYFMGLETRRSQFEDFGGIAIAHQIKILQNGSLGMMIRVDPVSPAGSVPANTFRLRGHEWNRAFTAEVR